MGPKGPTGVPGQSFEGLFAMAPLFVEFFANFCAVFQVPWDRPVIRDETAVMAAPAVRALAVPPAQKAIKGAATIVQVINFERF